MKKFQMKADIEFMAEDIDDAFRKLADHFTCLADNSECDSKLLVGGEISIEPVDCAS